MNRKKRTPLRYFVIFFVSIIMSAIILYQFKSAIDGRYMQVAFFGMAIGFSLIGVILMTFISKKRRRR